MRKLLQIPYNLTDTYYAIEYMLVQKEWHILHSFGNIRTGQFPYSHFLYGLCIGSMFYLLLFKGKLIHRNHPNY